MLTNSQRTNVAPPARFKETLKEDNLSPNRRTRFGTRRYEPAGRETPDLHARPAVDVANASVEISPPDVVRRRVVSWDGMTAEIVQATGHEKIEYRFRAPFHLLAVCEQGARHDGETFVEG